jgi:hypothetical protein
VQERAAKRSRTNGAAAAGSADAHVDAEQLDSDFADGSGGEQEEDEVDFEPEIVEDDRQDVKVRGMRCCLSIGAETVEDECEGVKVRGSRTWLCTGYWKRHQQSSCVVHTMP